MTLGALQRVIVSVAASLGVVAGTAQSQFAGIDSSKGNQACSVLSVLTDADSAIVFIDSVRVGVTPLLIDSLRPGQHRVTIHHPDISNWLTGRITDSVVVRPGDTLTLRYAFERRCMVVSQPSGAEVFLGDSLMGVTPFMAHLKPEDDSRALRVVKSGYAEARANLSGISRGVLAVSLKKEWKSVEEVDSPFRDQHESVSQNLRLSITGGGTVLAGIAAAYFKTKADERYQDYLDSGNISARDQTRRYDTVATVALVATQFGLGLFTYFVLSE